ncbi:DegT/DnrJ/EryC1/StrS family aminotransferase [Meiothermus ruber]|jgi:dTDP-4-amino-4,6-dideoxygalactose transaminase|uniref:Glutamine--scyllo-inositol transaminase n=1 Tax=Meiothermus ruber (strain ATCC 35948 / DSM 1279 / VKM B-1258 / 21) TaxID=504728 RepID=D3PM34_MEIRD|nr:DegT/DnrJ/EryC1/StrS aminotransferase family protein [Meiothermus ruber]ADD27145.1 Glutamine--scyllo-inositol transaminase [Meiothermus ruber DSM 1279]AGK03598.1 glutamine--scyllo-inositol transaminase [Meiothermus ruber DSM 1279]MCL6531572.1 DegT/DnrJ/EryC1/StrS aminotransferase family protein [Meiothermus ruber]MCX7801990.1 DegT/DnrJ/EryC1/StrS aminotransferase family protein [Meiothermus ruber]GAO74068.1 glutamine--scyllo-inositol transaminase [Meiothermus ruber H328]
MLKEPFIAVPFAPWPYFAPDEIEAATKVLQSGKVNYWTGQEGRLFEREFADYVGTKHAIALHNGTVALELALYAMGVGEGDEVITTPRTFIASASAAVMRGARPVFADVDPESGLITAETIERAITPRTKAIIVVHLAGWPADMDAIMALAHKHNLWVIEDCAQAHGARYKGRSVGSIGHAGAWSFCQDKILTTGGEGGMLTLNDDELWSKAWSFKDHGKSYDAVYNRQHPPGFRWLHEDFGTNWRMLEVQSAIGRVILRKLDGWVEQRRANAHYLSERFRQIPALRVPEVPAHLHHAYYKYYVYVRPERLKPGWSRDRIMQAVSELGIPCMSGSCSEIYLEKAFTRRGWQPAERLPVARELGETSLMFLVHPTLGQAQMQATADAVERVMEQASI